MSQTITLTNEQWATLTNGQPITIQPPTPTHTQWHPEPGDWYVQATGLVVCEDSDQRSREFGTERKTKADAEEAARKMRKFNRLLAYVEEFKTKEGDFEVYYNTRTFKYDYCNMKFTYASLTTIRMSYECAEQLVHKLNSGEVVL